MPNVGGRSQQLFFGARGLLNKPRWLNCCKDCGSVIVIQYTSLHTHKHNPPHAVNSKCATPEHDDDNEDGASPTGAPLWMSNAFCLPRCEDATLTSRGLMAHLMRFAALAEAHNALEETKCSAHLARCSTFCYIYVYTTHTLSNYSHLFTPTVVYVYIYRVSRSGAAALNQHEHQQRPPYREYPPPPHDATTGAHTRQVPGLCLRRLRIHSLVCAGTLNRSGV